MNRIIQILLTQPDPVGAAASLDLKREVGKELADKNAGKARTRWSVAYPFQDEEYRLAASEAEAYQANPAGGPFPSVQADVDAGTVDPRTSNPVVDLAEAADIILFKRTLYETALSDIRALRLAAKAQVKIAGDEGAVRAALNITWPNP